MRRGRILLAHDADDLLQLVHQRGFVVQAAGGVDQQDVGPLAARALVSASKARPAASVLGGPEITGAAGALAPDLQLLHRGGAERVAGDQHGVSALLAIVLREFADGRGLAGAVDADHRARHAACARGR